MQISRKLLKQISILLIISGIILSVVSIIAAFSLGVDRIDFFRDEDIVYEKFSVEIRDGASIKGVMYIDDNLYNVDNNSVPMVLMLNGINSRKEDNINKAYQLVKRGFVVFSVEQRGHGESTGPSGFLGKEPYDMVEILDYVENNYDFPNISHVALFAFSYGGGIGAILQGIDDRIYATVLYHPLASLDLFLSTFPFQNLIGTTPTVTRLEEIQDAYDIANETNTENLLLIHGTSDTLISPESSIGFYSLLNGENRTDIELKLRPGLSHIDNEYDHASLKFSLAWFEHYFFNSSIDISNLDSEIANISLYPFAYPDSSISENAIIIASLLLFIGISIQVILFKIQPFWERLPGDKSPFEELTANKKYKKMIIYRSSAYLLTALITGILCLIFNVSLLYGYFVLYPLVTLVILLFIPSELHSNWKEEWKNWIKHDAPLFLYTILAIAIPMIIFLIIYNLNAIIMIKSIIPILNTSMFFYIVMGFGSGVMDYLFLREFNPKHVYFLMIIRLVSLLIFVGFVPIPPSPLLGGIVSHIGFFLLFGVITFYIRQLVMYISKFYKSSMALYCLIMFPLIILFVDIFFRIV
jgi:alpha/beta superfamily hydrolase